MANIGCSAMTVKFIKFLTHERFIYTAQGNGTPRTTGTGVPQGGVLSPLLCTIYVSVIERGLSPGVAQGVTQFADDIAVYTKSNSVSRSLNLVEKNVKIIQSNLKMLGLDLSPDKSVLVHYNRRRVPPIDSYIMIDNHQIKASQNAKFLGIQFDNKITFKRHIEHV